MDIDILIGMAAAVIIASVKNPAHKATLKKVMLKIYTTIKLAYADDPDFGSKE